VYLLLILITAIKYHKTSRGSAIDGLAALGCWASRSLAFIQLLGSNFWDLQTCFVIHQLLRPHNLQRKLGKTSSSAGLDTSIGTTSRSTRLPHHMLCSFANG
jgi:hypothetical protein